MRARWTPEEWAMLMQLQAEGKSNDEKAAALGRTLASIEGKIRVARKSGLIPKSDVFWTPEQYALLKTLRDAGHTGDQIAVRLGRGSCAVRAKAHRCIRAGVIECKFDKWSSADQAGVPVSELANYRFYRSKDFPAAEAAAMCQARS